MAEKPYLAREQWFEHIIDNYVNGNIEHARKLASRMSKQDNAMLAIAMLDRLGRTKTYDFFAGRR